MAAVDIIVRARRLATDLEEVVEYLNRELFELLPRLLRETNNQGGDTVSVGTDYSVRRRDGVVLCENTLSINIELPDPTDVPDKRITIVRADSGPVSITDAAGGTISGSSLLSPAAQWNGYEFVSAKGAWYVVGAF